MKKLDPAPHLVRHLVGGGGLGLMIIGILGLMGNPSEWRNDLTMLVIGVVLFIAAWKVR